MSHVTVINFSHPAFWVINIPVSMQTSLVLWPHLLHDASQVMGVGSRMEYVCYLSSFCWWNEPTFGLDPGLACRSEQSTAGHSIEGQVKSAFCKGDSVQHHSVRQCYVLTSLEVSAVPFCQLWLVWCSQHSLLFTVRLCLVLPGLNTGIEAPVVIISPIHFLVWPRHLLFLSGNCQKDTGIQNVYISGRLAAPWRMEEPGAKHGKLSKVKAGNDTNISYPWWVACLWDRHLCVL